MGKIFTSESVTAGHPDKLCDLIADKILDYYLEKDKKARVAVEVIAFNLHIHIFGQVTSSIKVENETFIKIAKDTLSETGYNKKEFGLTTDNVIVTVDLDSQSREISSGVDKGGAGDQGLMFGYASIETKDYMPLAISLAHRLSKELTRVRTENIIEGLGPDGKTQVTINTDDNDFPTSIHTVCVSTMHSESKDLETLRKEILKEVILPVCKDYLNDESIIQINPVGSFTIGGPIADSGLTGRKNIVDSYGGYSRHGGGSYSGKDPSKVDRSASYMARYVAKNVVAAGLCDKIEIQVSYLIGISDPVGLSIITFGTNHISDAKILEAIKKTFSFRPKDIISSLELESPIYAKTTNYGHFGGEKDYLSWEKLDKVLELKKFLLN
ncbi:MAG: methionine adenosyltransferase [Acholeplasmatales bacterium]|jgi:S-adenosylmethionine synthetase|nr:methionine adenosyltransferase [Acholeplasmatales bacterium]